MSGRITSGLERFAAEFKYRAYDHQLAFHQSTAPHRLLGGAAGPGKTLALIMDHMMACAQFSRQDAPQVHTLILRRTHPKLASTVITRFREKIPQEFYRDFNESKCIVTWRNGSTTQFGSMQHEHDVWGWQGQWFKIGYDELTEFTFPQWQNISAWNRCPVSKWCTKDGATNPVGIGAQWVEDLFVSKRPCAEMDKSQRANYDQRDYTYFPATYLDNPIYANDANWIAGLNAYQAAVRDALMHGKWGVAGGYFDGAWDEASNVYPADSVEILPHWRKWLGGDWGFDHNSAIHWFCMDDLGIVRIYRELIVNRHTAEELGESILQESRGHDGNLEKYEFFSFSHDAFAERQDGNPIARRMGAVLRRVGLPEPTQSTKDKRGREQILYDMLRQRVLTGETVNGQAVAVAKLQIADCCPNLISTIPKAPRDEKNSEEIAKFLGDDSLQSSGYGLYALFGRPQKRPIEMRILERLEERIGMKLSEVKPEEYTHVMMQRAVIAEQENNKDQPFRLIGRRRYRRGR
jgi:hypothetical protein